MMKGGLVSATSTAILILVAFALWLIAVGLFALAAPRRAIRAIGAFASTTLVNLAELVLRGLVGAAFILAAPLTPYPRAFAVIGWMLVVSAIILLLLPRRWHAGFATSTASRMPVALVLVCAPVSLAAGAFLLWTVLPLLP